MNGFLKFKDGADLEELAGETGKDVLNSAALAVDDLAKAGVAAREQADPDMMDESAAEDAAEGECETEGDPAVREMPDLEAMKQAIQKIKGGEFDGAKPDPEPVPVPANDAELVQLREHLGTLQTEVNAVRADLEAMKQAAASTSALKDLAALKDLPVRLAAFEAKQADTIEVVAGLFDLVMGYQTGQKQIVIERNGQGSVHDPAGVELQKQMETMVGASGPTSAAFGQYAGDQLFSE